MVLMIFYIIVFMMVLVNFVLYVKLNDTIERLEDTLTDLDIIYMKLQRMTRDIKDVFAVHKVE